MCALVATATPRSDCTSLSYFGRMVLTSAVAMRNGNSALLPPIRPASQSLCRAATEALCAVDRGCVQSRGIALDTAVHVLARSSRIVCVCRLLLGDRSLRR